MIQRKQRLPMRPRIPNHKVKSRSSGPKSETKQINRREQTIVGRVATTRRPRVLLRECSRQKMSEKNKNFHESHSIEQHQQFHIILDFILHSSTYYIPFSSSHFVYLLHITFSISPSVLISLLSFRSQIDSQISNLKFKSKSKPQISNQSKSRSQLPT